MAQQQDASHASTMSVPARRRGGSGTKARKAQPQHNEQDNEAALHPVEGSSAVDEASPQKFEEIAPYCLADIVKSWLPIGSNAFLFYVVMLTGLVVAVISFAKTGDKTLLWVIAGLVARNIGMKIADMVPGLARIAEIVQALGSKEKGH